MGYTHYFELKEELTEEVLNDVRRVLNKYPELRFECDSDEPPVVSREYIRFNGVGEDGYETFYVEPFRREFCKTNREFYDLPVCEVLLVLKYYYGDSFDLSSDGFWVNKEEFERGELGGNWGIALENVRDEFGYRFKLVGEISESSGHKYYKLGIFPDYTREVCE